MRKLYTGLIFLLVVCSSSLSRPNFVVVLAADPEYASVIKSMETELQKQMRDVAIDQGVLPNGKSGRLNKKEE